MKIKFMKRIIAAIIAISAIATTPGFASAVWPKKDYLGKKRARTKNNFSEENEESNFSEENEESSFSEENEESKFSEEDDEEYKYSEKFYEETREKKKVLEYKSSELKAFKDFVDKYSSDGFKGKINGKNFADLVKKIAKTFSTRTRKYLLDQSQKIVKILIDSVDGEHCVVEKDVKKSFANAIEILAYQGFMEKSAESEVLKVMDLLVQFADEPELGEHVFAAIVALMNSSNLLKNYFNNKSAVEDLLFKFTGNGSLKKYVAMIIDILISKDLAKEYFQDNAEKIMNLLVGFFSEKQARRYAALALNSLASEDLAEEYFKNNLSKVIDALLVCDSADENDVEAVADENDVEAAADENDVEAIADENDVEAIAEVFVTLSKKGSLKELLKSEISKIKPRLVDWQKSPNLSKFAAEVIAHFASEGLFSENKNQNETESEAYEMIGVFFKCDREAISKNVGLLASLKLLEKHLTRDKFFSLLLTRWSLSAMTNSEEEKISVALNMNRLFRAKLQICVSLGEGANKIEKISAIMLDCAKANSKCVKKYVLESIVYLADNPGLSLVTGPELLKLKEISKKCNVEHDEEIKKLFNEASVALNKIEKEKIPFHYSCLEKK